MKIKQILLILGIAWGVSISAETVYKTRDAEGNIIFSDVPSEGAETIEIENAQTINIPQPVELDNRPITRLSPKEIDYTQLEITSPENDVTIRDNEGIVNVSVEIMPELDEKHRIVFLLDGNEVSSGRSSQLILKNIDRGTHSIAVLVKNEKDRIITQSDKSVFHLRKESKLFKNRTIENTEATPPVDTGSSPEIPKIPAL